LSLQVIILQHPKERTHAKNTVSLLKLITDQITVIDAKDSQQVNALLKKIEVHNTAIIYPSDRSLGLESSVNNKTITSLKYLILLDGSWSQAYSIYQSIDALKELDSYHLETKFEQQYAIRKAKKPDQLSTLEATAYSLMHITGQNPKPFIRLFKAMQEHWQRYSKP
jgi:DTW domain-containing protein YfiP